MAPAGSHTLRSGKLHRRDKKTHTTKVIRPGDRFNPTERELRAFSDCIITWPAYLALTSDVVEEVEGDDPMPPPTDKPKRKRKSRAKTAKKPEPEEGSEPEVEPVE